MEKCDATSCGDNSGRCRFCRQNVCVAASEVRFAAGSAEYPACLQTSAGSQIFHQHDGLILTDHFGHKLNHVTPGKVDILCARRNLVECPLAQPGRTGIDHRARQHRHRTQSVVRQRGAVGTATVGKNDVVAIKRRGIVALVDERPALQLQIDGVVVRGRLVDVALGADDLVAGGLAHCEAQRPRAAYAHAGEKRSFGASGEMLKIVSQMVSRQNEKRSRSGTCPLTRKSCPPPAKNYRGNARITSVAPSAKSIAPQAKTACGACVYNRLAGDSKSQVKDMKGSSRDTARIDVRYAA